MAPHRVLIVSHVLPFPLISGQQQRVFYTIKAARERFHVTFLTKAEPGQVEQVGEKLSELCDDVIVMPSLVNHSLVSKLWHRVKGEAYRVIYGLKFSNYVIGKLEFSQERLASALRGRDFVLVLYEYWHAVDSTTYFRARSTPCVLDMHDLLWRSYARQLDGKKAIPQGWKRWAIERYRCREEQAWERFDALVTINREEQRYVESVYNDGKACIFYTPMGVDLSSWPYSWSPSMPVRIGYYGGLGSPRNQQAALNCYHQIMPQIWTHFPEAELWIVGSNPPESIQALGADARVKVTGFVPEVQRVLTSMSLVICPWSGKFGFRSRIVEVMSLGVPVVASPDAVWGMELEHGDGILLGDDILTLTAHSLQLLTNKSFAHRQSHLARERMEEKYSLDATYGQLIRDLSDWLEQRK